MNNNASEIRETVSFGKAANSEFNNQESIESVYSNDSIDLLEVLSTEPVTTTHSELTQDAANEEVVQADIYSLSGARRSKLDKSLERRACKSRLTDRRQSARMDADGVPQLDRRAENRLVNVDSLRPKDV